MAKYFIAFLLVVSSGKLFSLLFKHLLNLASITYNKPVGFHFHLP